MEFYPPRSITNQNAQLKSRHAGTSLSEDELDAKAKAWLLMVEAGKTDEDHIRKIIPKSIFIAPLLTSRSNKCREGYTHDHLGRCVKVIKMDQKTQLELLLKRLSAMYADRKSEEEGLSHVSSGPLQFSLPISGTDKTGKDENNTSVEVENATAAVSYELTNKTKDDELNETDEMEYSGSGGLNDSYVDGGFEGSGWGGTILESDDSCCNDTAESATLISDELDYTEVRESTTELDSTEVPYTTEIYESAVNESDFVTPPEKVNDEYRVTEKNQDRPNNSRIVFPDSLEVASGDNGRTRPHQPIPNFQLWTPVAGNLRPNNQHDDRKLPPQQLWWTPPNWRVYGEQRKPTVFKFWVPLTREPGFNGEDEENARRPFAEQQYSETVLPPTRVPEGSTTKFQQPLLLNHRRGRVFGARRVGSDRMQPRSLLIR